MRELATHYRIAGVDTMTKKFVGEVSDYWVHDSLMVALTYDQNGKNGQIKMRSLTGNVELTGQYLGDKREGIWKVIESDTTLIDFSVKKPKPHKTIDSLEECLRIKESFQVSQYIRKADYPEIYSLIFKPHSSPTINGWTAVEERPYFPNGTKALGQFIEAFIKYPDEALKNNIKGQVDVQFTITEDGSTSDFKVISGLGYGCDEEAIRVLKLLPDWVPGYQRGKPVRTKFKLTITFG